MTWFSAADSLSAVDGASGFFSSPGAGGADSGLPLGKDCPALTAPLLKQAALQLQTHDAVLLPAHDGGYVLLGLKSFTMASPDICARKPSTSCDCVVDLSSTVFFKPSFGEPVNAPPNT